MPEIDKYLLQMLAVKASDLHLASGYAPICRINGELQHTNMPPMPPRVLNGMLMEILDDERVERFNRRRTIEFSYELPDAGRFRASAYYHHRGLDLVIRSVPPDIPKLADLGFPANLEQLCAAHQGLILVTGPDGGGKTTTLASMIDRINDTRGVHVIALENTIEFVHQNKKALVNQREVGDNARSYSSALKAALKQKPEVILIGEMNDLETISMAINVAENGCLVLGTLHARDVQGSVYRLVNVFPVHARPQIQARTSQSLLGVISQRLIPKKGGAGRVLAYEVMLNSKQIGLTIRDGKMHQLPSIMRVSKAAGNVLMDDVIIELFKDGKITHASALAAVRDKEDFEKRHHPPADETA